MLKDENGFYKDNQERLTRQIKDLKYDLRKYELEVDTLADQKHQETNNFITSLPNRSIDKNNKEIDISSNIITDQVSFRNGNFELNFINITVIITNFLKNKEAEKDNFFKSFNEAQKDFQDKKQEIQHRIASLQNNLEDYLKNTGNINSRERFNETKLMNSELFGTNQKETPKPYMRSNNLG